MEKELTAAVTTQEPMLADSLIVVQQLPVIKEQLHRRRCSRVPGVGS